MTKADAKLDTNGQPIGPSDREFEELTRITNELITTQRQLHKQGAVLRKLNEEKNLAIGTVAHDLRNPLALIEMESNFLLSETPGQLNESQRELLESICQQGRLMLSIVNDLLDVSALDSGQFRLQVAATKMIELVGRNVRRNSLLASEKLIPIRFQRPDHEFEACIDANKFEQVLNNLIVNAVKYSPTGSEVDVVLQCREDDFELQVLDQGPGIPAGEQEALFSPFTTAGVEAQAGEKSTGLGLAIVRRIVEKHGGSINVDSNLGCGACFTVGMPRQVGSHGETVVAEPAIEQAMSATHRNETNPRRVLIVDDSFAAARMIARMLESFCETEIEFAHDGQSALEKVTDFHPDVVLLDIELPILSGGEVARCLQQRYGEGVPRLCAITGHRGTALDQHVDRDCFDLVLTKPIAIDELRDVMSY